MVYNSRTFETGAGKFGILEMKIIFYDCLNTLVNVVFSWYGKPHSPGTTKQI